MLVKHELWRYFYASARKRAAGEMGFLGFDKVNLTIDGGVDGEIAAHESTWASNFRATSLTHENFSGFDFLAA